MDSHGNAKNAEKGKGGEPNCQFLRGISGSELEKKREPYISRAKRKSLRDTSIKEGEPLNYRVKGREGTWLPEKGEEGGCCWK